MYPLDDSGETNMSQIYFGLMHKDTEKSTDYLCVRPRRRFVAN